MEKALNVILASKDIGTKIWFLREVGMFIYHYNDEIEGGKKLLEQAVRMLANARPKLQEQNRWLNDRYGLVLI